MIRSAKLGTDLGKMRTGRFDEASVQQSARIRGRHVAANMHLMGGLHRAVTEFNRSLLNLRSRFEVTDGDGAIRPAVLQETHSYQIGHGQILGFPIQAAHRLNEAEKWFRQLSNSQRPEAS